MIDFIRNYPFRFYLQHAFRAPQIPDVNIHLKSNGHVNMLIDQAGDQRLYVEDSIGQHEGTLGTKLADAAGTAPYRLSYLLDAPEIELRLITLDALGLDDIDQLKATPIRSLLPAFEGNEQFIWEFLGTDLLPLEDPLPDTVLLIGIPLQLREQAEHLSDSTEGFINRIEPHLLAILRYAQEETDNFLLIPGDAQSMLALFDNGNLIVLERHPGIQSLGLHPERLSDRINEFAASLNIGNPTLTIYPGEVAAIRARELADKLPLGKVFIEPPHPPDDDLKAEEGRLPLEAFVLRNSRCYPGGAFVSDEHREKSRYFTDRHYRGTFYVLVVFAVLQLISGGIFIHQWLSLEGLTAEATHIKAQVNDVEQKATLLTPLIQRIQASAKWTAMAKQRQPVSQLLSSIEALVPQEVCLRSISITDTGHTSEQSGSRELTITGWSQPDYNFEAGFLGELRMKLPEFTATANPPALADEASLPVFHLNLSSK